MVAALADSLTTTVHRALLTDEDMRLTDPDSGPDRHRKVMALFPFTLPGPASERRASSNILFRFDPVPGGGYRVIVQATTPINAPGATRNQEVPVSALIAPQGALVRFRLTANTVRRSDHSERPLRLEEVPAWLTARLEGALTDIDIIDIARTSLTGPSNDEQRRRIQLDTIEATATVTNPAHLAHLVTTGVGRAKAYGAGLLTLIRIG